MGVPDRFQRLLAKIQPSATDHASVERHLSAIKTRLSFVFNVKSFLVTGSYSRGSSIHNHSDLDLFVVISRDDVRWGRRQLTSTTILEQFRQELMGRYPNTVVRKDVHAITVAFTDGLVDVVPAYFERMATIVGKMWPVYSMPDGNGYWKESSPTRHNAYIHDADVRSGGKLKYTAQLIKHWRYSRSVPVPVSSFHVELLMASERLCEGVRGYSLCVRDTLRSLAARNCRGIQDPIGISGVIDCSRTEPQRFSALRTVLDSRDHANTACATEVYGVPEAVRQWKIVFNQDFPA